MENPAIRGEQWKTFALFLNRKMMERGLNHSQLAEKAGVHRSTIKRFFEFNFPLKLDIVLAIAEALEVELEAKDLKTGDYEKI